MKTNSLFFAPAVLLLSCRTASFPPPQELPWTEPAEIIVVERPVYIPESSAVPERAPARGPQAARNSNAEGIVQPQDYSHAAMIYDYSPDFVYEVYAQPLRVTDIRLEPGERVIETPFVSDSERWLLGAGVSFENGTAVQHIYVKPAAAPLEASIIINTDRRTYHAILKSYSAFYMPMVRWRYPLAGLPENYAQPASPGGGGSADAAPPGGPQITVDPRFASFDYAVRKGLARKPQWFPELVYDDGRKTYIVFPRGVLQASLPAVFDGRDSVVNYRVVEHVAVIDRLVEKMTVRLDGREITIEKKRGR